MKNDTIKIAITSILIYLIFKKTYDIFTELLLWLNVKLRIDNEYILITINIIVGFLSLYLLIFLYNHYLQKKTPKNNTIYFLISISVFISIIDVVINKLYGEYLSDIDMNNFREIYLFQFSWSKTIDFIFPILALFYFLWKMLKKRI